MSLIDCKGAARRSIGQSVTIKRIVGKLCLDSSRGVRNRLSLRSGLSDAIVRPLRCTGPSEPVQQNHLTPISLFH